MKVLVLGTAKSGTTAVYTAIRNALGDETDYLYEPSQREEFEVVTRSVNRNVLAKVFFTIASKVALDFSMFDKVVLLTRDPRDVTISFLLFNFLMNYRSREAMPSIIALLRRKEADPRSLSLQQLSDQSADLCTRVPRWDSLAAQLDYSMELTKSHPEFFTARYEDFIDRNVEGLSHFLGLPISAEVEVGEWVKHVARSKGYGDWKHWFTAEDVDTFRPLFEPYLEFYRYDPQWSLAPDPVVRREFASGYIEKNLKEIEANPLLKARPPEGVLRQFRRALARFLRGIAEPGAQWFTEPRGPGYTKQEIAKLRAAAADGKPVALRKLAMAYKSGNGVEKDLGQAIALLRQAAHHKDLPSMVELASLRLREESEEGRREALPLLEVAAAKENRRALRLLAAHYREQGQGEADAAKAAEYSARAIALQAAPKRRSGSLARRARDLIRRWMAKARPRPHRSPAA